MKFWQSILLLFCCFFTNALFAQKENNVWTFGGGISLDFNFTNPKIGFSSIISEEGCSSICDTSGKLLFYSDGNTVWDNTNTPMPNGSGLLGATTRSSTQGVAFAPIFTKPDFFMLFSLEQENGFNSGYLRYSVIDRKLNSGKGDIVLGAKNIILDTGRSEKMQVALGCNSLWLLTHAIDSPVFFAYNIDAPFTIGAPVVSKTLGIKRSRHYYVGEMKISPNFDKIAMVNFTPIATGIAKPKAAIELFDFEKKTGVVSNYYAIDSSYIAYSVEFSPDGTKLYVCEWDSAAYQYDLSLLPNIAAVRASKYRLLGNHYASIRRAPNDKLYAVRYGFQRDITVINKPNEAGSLCDVVINDALLKNTNAYQYFIFGNNTVMPIEGIDETRYSSIDTYVCAGNNFYFGGNPSHRNFRWNDGSTAREKVFNSAGKYWLTSTKGCTQYIDTLNLKLRPKNFISSVADTSFCFRKDYIVQPKNLAAQYLWSNGSRANRDTFTHTGVKWVSYNDLNCNYYIDTFKVNLTNFDVVIRDTFICPGDTLHFDVKVPFAAAKYLWSDNSDDNKFATATPGFYWVNVQVGNCSKKEDFYLAHKTFETNFENVTRHCESDTAQLSVIEKNAQYIWGNGSTNSSISVSKTGNYSVVITKDNCSVEQAVYVEFIPCENCIHIPNAFTPNGDEINDRFRVLSECIVDQFSIQIYNRWGEIVYESINHNEGWNGTTKGLLQNSGVYFYLVKVKFMKANSPIELYKGDITLIR